MADPMISVRSLSAEFGGVELFSGLAFDIMPGEKVLLDGPSGSGKTTLFRMLLGFSFPKLGTLAVDGLTVQSQNIQEVRKRIAYLSQDIDFRSVKVKDLMDEIFSYDLNKDVSYDEKGFIQSLALFGLQRKIMSDDVESLSGGERQRLGLAICFALGRPILLLDEPTSALDKARKSDIVKSILKSDKTVVVISHDQQWKKGLRVVKLGHA